MGVINSIVPILIILLIGFICKKYWLTDLLFWKNINKLIYYVMFPCLITYSIAIADLTHTDYSYIPILIVIVIILMLLIWTLKGLFKDQKFWVAYIQGATRYNSYIFISVTFYYMGKDAMPAVASITAFLVMTINIFSVLILNIYSDKKTGLYNTLIKTLTNPLILSCILGLLINKVATYIPAITHIIWLNNTLDKVGEASLALSLMGVGACLKLDVIRRAFWGVMSCSLIKLIISPLVVILTLKYFGYSETLIMVCAIYAGSPCSSNATAMVESMDGDYHSMSLIISVQTILSLFTIAFWLLLFNFRIL